MKKITQLICLALAMLLLCACGNTGVSNTEATQGATESTGLSAEERGYYIAADYLADPSLFVPAWEGQFTVPEAMLDWEEKFQQFFTPDGRTMSIGHRGDRNIYYPENSIEGFLSVIMAGVDIVEVDVVLTKDKIPVVMHDDDLLRTTNLTLKRLDGEAEGLPESNYVKDWTLEELRQLRLVMSETTGETTNYVIPTLEDVISIAKGRVFITLDKFKRFDWNQDIVPVIEKLEAYETVLIPYPYTRDMGFTTTSFLMKRLVNGGARKVGCTAIVTPDTIAQVTADIEANDFPKAIRCGEYKPDDAAFAAAYLPYAGQYRMFFETLERNNDNRQVWQQMDEQGFNIIMSNVDPYGLTQYIAETYFS